MKPREVEVQEEGGGSMECVECEREMERERVEMCPWCDKIVCDDCWTQHREDHGFDVALRDEGDVKEEE